MTDEQEFYYATSALAHLQSGYSLDRETYEGINKVLARCDANIRVGPSTRNGTSEVAAGLSTLGGPFIGIYMRKPDRDKTGFLDVVELSLEEALLKLEIAVKHSKEHEPS